MLNLPSIPQISSQPTSVWVSGIYLELQYDEDLQYEEAQYARRGEAQEGQHSELLQ